jgi:hypothetical protein
MAEYQALYNSPALAAGPDALRFLEQSTWGPTDTDLTHLRSVGMMAYLNEQFSMPPLFPAVQSNYPATPLYPQFYPGAPTPACDAICSRDNYTLYPLQKQFMTNALTQPDQLRQRLAFALHKVIVVGGQPLNSNETSWYAPYLQTIDRNSFGNFRTLLFEVTLNPGMGEYLNMRGNSVVNRANPTPNENYAREVMQLFSIGVDTLNQDGTPVLDSQGNRVPSYDQTTIANLARVFTGWDLDASKLWSVDGTTSVTNYLDPMVPNGNINRYDIAQKTLDGIVPPKRKVAGMSDAVLVVEPADIFNDGEHGPRLLYVALTRAEDTLLLSGHHWGASETKPRGPSEFLCELKEIIDGSAAEIIDGSAVVGDPCGVVEHWAPAPADGDAGAITGGGGIYPAIES